MKIGQRPESGQRNHGGHLGVLLTSGRQDTEICDAIVELNNSCHSTFPSVLSFAQWKLSYSCHSGVAETDEIMYANIISYNSWHIAVCPLLIVMVTIAIISILL